MVSSRQSGVAVNGGRRGACVRRERSRGSARSEYAWNPDAPRLLQAEQHELRQFFGANDSVCTYQWGGLTHDRARRSIDLFVEAIMPHYR
jgi:hypothetical protein